jgi:hypothetical protein
MTGGTIDWPAFTEELVKLTRAFHDLYAAWRPGKHKQQCPKCNPGGNPGPLAVDGHEYQRRLRNRRKRGH